MTLFRIIRAVSATFEPPTLRPSYYPFETHLPISLALRTDRKQYCYAVDSPGSTSPVFNSTASAAQLLIQLHRLAKQFSAKPFRPGPVVARESKEKSNQGRLRPARAGSRLDNNTDGGAV